MIYKLLSVSKEGEINIGDYIQALASSQFLPSIDGFVDRETLKDYNGEECKVIMNGWYMHHPEQWPPSKNINPLFVALHINSTAKDTLLSEESVKYFKQHEPIGCRDTNTVDMLKSKGIDAYFSACMTLTLGEKYHSEEKEEKCYFVDPYFITRWNLFYIVFNLIYLILHWKPINIIAKKYPENKKGLRKRMILATFYREYSKLFTKETLVNAEYISQQNKEYKTKFSTDEQRLSEAKRLVVEYARAKLVVTSRIHCALPCLGLGTPVLYTEDAQQSEASLCRLGGLRDLFTILKWDKNRLIPEFVCNGKLSIHNIIPNKSNWIVYAQQLKQVCISFVSNK